MSRPPLPTERTDLLVIEAPGKVQRLRNFCSSRGWSCSIQATSGRLYDLPETHLGVDLTTHGITHRVSISPSRLEHLRNAVLAASRIWIMTDPDDEGHWIGADVVALAPASRSKHTIFRAYLGGLSLSTLDAAFTQAEIYRSGAEGSAVARRVFDREVAALYSSVGPSVRPGETRGVVGRVLTPTLSALSRRDIPSAYITRTLQDRDLGGDFEAVIGLKPGSFATPQCLQEELADLPDIVVRRQAGAPRLSRRRIWSGPQALEGIASQLNMPVDVVARTLQKLYERGCVSYPRSESGALDAEQIDGLARLAQKLGAQGATSARSAIQELVSTYNGHQGLIPLVDDIPLNEPLAHLGPEDQALVVLTKHSFAAANPDYRESIELGEPTPSAGAARWAAWARDRDLTIRFLRKSRIQGYRQAGQPVPILHGIAGPPPHLVDRGPTTALLLRPDHLVCRTMLRYDLGRPSTLALHSDKIAGHYLDSRGELNKRAQQALQRAGMLTPRLLDPEIASRLTETLGRHDLGSSPSRVAQALNIAELDRDIGNERRTPETEINPVWQT